MDQNALVPPYPLDDLTPPPVPPKPTSSTPWREGSHKKLTRKHVAFASDPYEFLRHFDTVFLIDDSAAMAEHWEQVGSVLEQIAPICTEYDRNGIDIYFVNHHPRGYHLYAAIGHERERAGYLHIGKATGEPDMRDNVAGIFRGVEPGGRCRLDHRLSAILDPYVKEYGRRVRDGGKHGKNLRPLNIIVITAGVTGDNPNDTLIRTARAMDSYEAPQYQVGVQFFRVGDDHKGNKAMEFADDALSEALDIRDMVDTVTWTGKPGELSADAVLKVVLGAVERSIDKPDL
ncbi:hypothetical protein F4804DRAFT_84781 [Jackrogersella minutella]|nr:hypothetical protein F4804DRAFT_84781 [Jackrogersella minutella]